MDLYELNKKMTKIFKAKHQYKYTKKISKIMIMNLI